MAWVKGLTIRMYYIIRFNNSGLNQVISIQMFNEYYPELAEWETPEIISTHQDYAAAVRQCNHLDSLKAAIIALENDILALKLSLPMERK